MPSGELEFMYEAHFGLRGGPFGSTPDPRRYYAAGGHEAALATLGQALADGEALALLSGDAGLGKTLLCHCLLGRAGAARCAFVTNSHLADRAALFQGVQYELGLPYQGRTEQELRLALTDDLLTHAADHGPTLLVVDDAQHLSADLLEELRLLLNLEGPQGRALQVVLAGQPGLLATLEAPALASLRQRLAARARLEPLTAEEAADYLLHHLRAVSDSPAQLLTGEALEILAKGARGVPRLLSQSAHQALALACRAGAREVDAEAALEALAALGLEAVEEAEQGTPAWLPRSA
jgi:general secretion pathway protein A